MRINEDFNKGITDLNFIGTWTVQAGNGVDGSFALQSAQIGNSQKSESTLTFTANDKPHEFSFVYGVSSENNYDWLYVYLNDKQIIKVSGDKGIVGTFRQVIEAGNYTLKLSYQKDGSNSVGRDCAWIDDLYLEPMEPNILCVHTGEVNQGKEDGNLLESGIDATVKVVLQSLRNTYSKPITLAVRTNKRITYLNFIKIKGPQAQHIFLSYDCIDWIPGNEGLYYFELMDKNTLFYVKAFIPAEQEFGDNLSNTIQIDYLGMI